MSHSESATDTAAEFWNCGVSAFFYHHAGYLGLRASSLLFVYYFRNKAKEKRHNHGGTYKYLIFFELQDVNLNI